MHAAQGRTLGSRLTNAILFYAAFVSEAVLPMGQLAAGHPLECGLQHSSWYNRKEASCLRLPVRLAPTGPFMLCIS